MADRNHEDPAKEEDRKNEEVNVHPPDNPDLSRQRVCRRLNFDSEDLAREASDINDFLHLSSEEMQEQRRKAIEKWNFDFENEVPLEGNWEWERVPVASTDSKEIVCCMGKESRENRNV